MNDNKKQSKKPTVLFVCTGNTCRSAMAEFIFKDYLKKAKKLSRFKIQSAGTNVSPFTHGMASTAKECLDVLGIKNSKHMPRLLDPNLAASADYIICMTEAHKQAVVQLLDGQEANGCNIKTFAEIAGIPDISDPYGCELDVYIATAKIFLDNCEAIYNEIQPKE